MDFLFVLIVLTVKLISIDGGQYTGLSKREGC